jgi:ATPase subunit of ABC transporter with duplicated ATPase domains
MERARLWPRINTSITWTIWRRPIPAGNRSFAGISLHFLPDAKIGVVGVNGAGKSSLLRIMAGQDTDFTGEAWAEKGVRVGYLPQEPKLDPDQDRLGKRHRRV